MKKQNLKKTTKNKKTPKERKLYEFHKIFSS